MRLKRHCISKSASLFHSSITAQRLKHIMTTANSNHIDVINLPDAVGVATAVITLEEDFHEKLLLELGIIFRPSQDFSSVSLQL